MYVSHISSVENRAECYKEDYIRRERRLNPSFVMAKSYLWLLSLSSPVSEKCRNQRTTKGRIGRGMRGKA